MARKSRMDGQVSAAQVLRRLAEIEANGVAFYQGLASGTTSPRVREFALKLTKAERRHRKRFLAYAEHAEEHAREGENSLSHDLSPEIARLLRTSVVASEERVRSSAKYFTEEDALLTAIRNEETIGYLLAQMREYVPKRQQAYITRVIREEHGHQQKLEGMLRRRLARPKDLPLRLV